MKIHEYKAKEIFGGYNIPIPMGSVANDVATVQSIASKLGYPVVLKSQVLVGGRGKAGGIKVVTENNVCEETARQIFNMKIKDNAVNHILVEKTIDIASEMYLGFILDRDTKSTIMIFSAMGGVEIEEVAVQHPEAILKYQINPFLGILPCKVRELLFNAKVPKKQIGPIADIIQKLYSVYLKYNCMIAEINPLVVTKSGDVIALDGKINIDDNATIKMPGVEEMRDPLAEEPLERRAREIGLNYVKLDGEIGVIGNGAGLVMTTLDVINQAGGKAANFLDIGGGANAKLVEQSLSIIMSDKSVKGIMINIFGGITRCDEVARGILDVMSRMEIKMPMVIRLSGTNAAEGRELLAKSNLPIVKTMQEAAALIVSNLKTAGVYK